MSLLAETLLRVSGMACVPPPQVTELLGVSMELGCFLAGALVSSQGHAAAEEVVSCVEPVRDFLAIVFFASIGDFPPGLMPPLGLICSHVFEQITICAARTVPVEARD